MGSHPSTGTARSGAIYATLAYLLWGIAPLYWKQLEGVGPDTLLGHRVLFSTLFLLILVAIARDAGPLRRTLRSGRALLLYATSSVLLAANWFIYLYAIYSEQVLQGSLGYFINPILNVVLGLLVLGEKLRLWQWIAVLLATCGVLTMAFGAGAPWLALALALSFGIYGLVRKTGPAEALVSSATEMLILLLPAVAFLAIQALRGASVVGTGRTTLLLLPLTGLITALPLLWFGAAARRLPLSVLGFFQYLAPTCQFLLAVFVFDEPFSRNQLIAFCFIWAALLIFSVEAAGSRRQRRQRARTAAHSSSSIEKPFS